LARRIADIYLASSLGTTTRRPPSRRHRLSQARAVEKWTGLYVDPDDNDRVMRVRLMGATSEWPQRDGRFFSTSKRQTTARFRYIKEPLTELFSKAGEKMARQPALTTLHQRKNAAIGYFARAVYEPTPHSCRNSPECNRSDRSRHASRIS